MILTNRKARVILLIVVVLVILQAVRMGYLVQWNTLKNVYGETYELSEALKLAEADLHDMNQVTCLYIPSRGKRDNENYRKLFDYLKMEVTTISPDELISEAALAAYDLVILNEDRISKVASFEHIINYVKSGGNLIIGIQFDFYNDVQTGYYARDFGVLEWGGEEDYQGFTLKSELILGGDEVLLPVEGENFMMTGTSVSLDRRAKVHMVSQSNNPAIWEVELEEGKVVMMNTFIPDYEKRRAVILGCIELVQPYFVYPIINAEIVFIDDFPGKFSGNSDKVEVEYGRSIERFLSEIWWPDMVSTIKKYGIKYSCAFISSYNDNVEGDFDQNTLIDKNVLLSYGREIFKYGGEITYHGYNHQSLIFDQTLADDYGYSAWPGMKEMGEAIATSIDNFKAIFPEYEFITYVPPSNLLDRRSSKVLKEEIPSLQVYSGVMLGDDQGALIQEFEVGKNGIVELPRISSGSVVNPIQQLSVDSVVAVNGVVNHFIHPDDFMDEERSYGMTWEELFGAYDEFLSLVDSKYPWLEKTTSIRAAQKVKQYHYAEIYTKKEENTLTVACDHFGEEQSLVLSMDGTIDDMTGGTYERIGEHHYLIVMHENIVTLEVE